MILPGITRMVLISLAKEHSIPVLEKAFTVDEMMDADEVIYTSAGALCCPVSFIDGKPVGGRAPELLKTLQDASMARLHAVTSPVATPV